MRVYFDKENLYSFLACHEEDGFDDCAKMLKRYFDIFVNVSEEEYYSDPYLPLFSSLLTSGNKEQKEPHYKDEFIQVKRPIKTLTNFKEALSMDDFSAVFLLADIEDSKVCNSFLACPVGEELDTLLRVRFSNDDKPYTDYKPLQDNFEFSSWSALEEYALNCTDIIISDQFLLNYEQTLCTNLFPVIKILAGASKFLSIVIITLKSKTINEKVIEHDWDSIRKKLKTYLKQNGDIEAVVSFVAANDKHELKEHDRTIFTNYRYYAPGFGVNIYNKDGDNTSYGRHFTFLSLAEKDNYRTGFMYISDMQKKLDEIKSDSSFGIINVESEGILSNYLTF